MCGIVGYIGSKPVVDVLYEGLRRLEYRGYDSAGIAVAHGESKIAMIKREGKLAALQPILCELPIGTSGIGHTRWATHGPATRVNAHPHMVEDLALVHNGIIENYGELKAQLMAEGAEFDSATDTEVVVKLLARELKSAENNLAAVRATIKQLDGAFSLGILFADEPDHIYLVKLGSPLVIGLAEDEVVFASDALALVAHTSRAVFLNDRELARVSRSKLELWNFDGDVLTPKEIGLDISNIATEKQGFRHFMLKEIHEQPRVVAELIKRLFDLDQEDVRTDVLGLDHIEVDRIDNIVLVGCGTAFYSGLLAKYFIEPRAGVPVNVELASEFRYRNPWLSKGTLVIAVSQSGETLDTLESVKYAKKNGCQVLSICNVPMSSIARESDFALQMEIGPEIGVASTKAFTGMLTCHYALALGLAKKKGKLSRTDIEQAVAALRSMPTLLEAAIDTAGHIEEVAKDYYEAANFLFFGRGPNFGIALEGALKLKEISYIHAEGYAGGELKHGPIALVDQHIPIVAIAPQDFYYEKMLSNIEEVKAREGRVIAIGAAGDAKLARLADSFIACPKSSEPALQAILSVVPLQLLSYYIAVKRGTDVDQPRNLAKSVTVE